MWRNMSRSSLMKVPIYCTHWGPQITQQTTIPFSTSSKTFTSMFLVRDVTASRTLCYSCGRSFGSFGTKIYPSHSYTSRSHLRVGPVTGVVRNTQCHFLRCQVTSIAETVLSKVLLSFQECEQEHRLSRMWNQKNLLEDVT